MVAALIVVLALAGTEGAPVAHPSWVRRPDAKDMMSYYPVRAQRLGLDGHAVIDCKVAADEHLSDCAVVSEEPADFGFGDAALKLAPLFVLRAGTAPGASITIPIRFLGPYSPSTPSDSAPPPNPGSPPGPPAAPWRYAGPKE